MSNTDCSAGQLAFWKLGQQQVTADCSGGRVVSDAGLLAVRQMERGLGVLSELGQRLPDPRSQKFVRHDCERCGRTWRSSSAAMGALPPRKFTSAANDSH